MKLLDDAITATEAVYNYFGYKEDWRVIPLSDETIYFWRVDQDEATGQGSVTFADSIGELESGDGNCYSHEIYTQRHLPKWVYRGEDYTMISCDTHTDGNKFLCVFDNKKEQI